MYHFVQYLYHFILSCYDIMVVQPLENIFTVLLISKVVKIGAIKPIYFGFWFTEGSGGVYVCVDKGCYKYIYIVHILKSNKKFIFFASTSNLCRAIAMLPNYLRTYSCALCQISLREGI